MNSKLPIRSLSADDISSLSVSSVKRARLVRDATRPVPVADMPLARFALRQGEMYRISYSVGGTPQRRVSRSVAVFGGQTERRNWLGDTVRCLDFSLPHGRTLSLLADQLVDVRAAELNEQGQWVLADDESAPRRKRASRRLSALRPSPG